VVRLYLGLHYRATTALAAHTKNPRRHTVVKIRVRVGPSRIAGQGLFAGQDIQQGTKIIQYIGKKITHAESERRLAAGNVFIIGLDDRYAIDGHTPKNTARYINHACDPNCHTEQFGNTIWIVAIRDIEAGEELTHNYGYDDEDYENNPCHCGAHHCCGYILGPQYWDRIKQTAPREGAPQWCTPLLALYSPMRVVQCTPSNALEVPHTATRIARIKGIAEKGNICSFVKLIEYRPS